MNELIISDEMKQFVPDVEYRLIPADQLICHVGYQRDLLKSFVDKVVKDFNLHLIRPIRVSFRDGQYFVMDGMHTLSVLERISGRCDIPVWCEVTRGLSYEDEARIFSLQQKYRRLLTSYDITNAKIEAKDPNAIFMEQLVNSCGFRFGTGKGDYIIKATSSVQIAIEKYGAESVARALMLISDTWHGNPDYLKGPFIKAFSKVLGDPETKIDDEKFASKMCTTTFDEIKLEAKRVTPIYKIDYGQAIINIYYSKTSKRLKKNR